MPAPKKPQDRQAKAEAQGKDIRVDFNGATYTISRDNADDVELYELVEGEKYVLALAGYLGDQQWQRFKDANRNAAGKVTMGVFNDFLDAAMAAIGGNSPASPTS